VVGVGVVVAILLLVTSDWFLDHVEQWRERYR
jgi:hypothetical protein